MRKHKKSKTRHVLLPGIPSVYLWVFLDRRASATNAALEKHTISRCWSYEEVDVSRRFFAAHLTFRAFVFREVRRIEWQAERPARPDEDQTDAWVTSRSFVRI